MLNKRKIKLHYFQNQVVNQKSVSELLSKSHFYQNHDEGKVNLFLNFIITCRSDNGCAKTSAGARSRLRGRMLRGRHPLNQPINRSAGQSNFLFAHLLFGESIRAPRARRPRCVTGGS